VILYYSTVWRMPAQGLIRFAGVRRPMVLARPARHLTLCSASLLILTLAGCRDDEAPAPVPRPVRTVVAVQAPTEETLSLTGQVQPQEQVSLAFRIPGRMLERLVDVGTPVRAGDVVARLDRRPEADSQQSAQAAVAAAQAQLVQVRGAFERQRKLLTEGFTTKAQFDQAQQQLQTIEAQLQSATAQASTASDRVAYTELRADAAGVVTDTGAEAGEVVSAGQMIVRVAREGGRDAWFQVPASLLRTAPRDIEVSINLTDAPEIRTTGRVREVAPQADAATRTYLVKVGLTDPPTAMRLGSTVTGSIRLLGEPAVTVPASALTRSGDGPAVWVVDPTTFAVSLVPVVVRSYGQDTVVLTSGVDNGMIVVTAGVQALRPAQVVRLLEQAQ
jgi:membrane fusion protein, multidrug efflux system